MTSNIARAPWAFSHDAGTVTDAAGGLICRMDDNRPETIDKRHGALIAEAPAMLEALRELVDAGDSGAKISDSYAYSLARAILARIDGAPSGEAVGDDPAVRAAANLSRAGLIDAAREAEALAAPISEAVGATGGPAASADLLEAARGVLDGGSWQDDGSFTYYPPTDEADDEGAIGALSAAVARINRDNGGEA